MGRRDGRRSCEFERIVVEDRRDDLVGHRRSTFHQRPQTVQGGSDK